MPGLDKTALVLSVAGVLVVGAAWAYSRRQGGAAGLGAAVGGAAVDAVAGAATGAVKAVGAVVGVPDTNLDQCRADMAAGRTWDASFSCPLPVFLKYLNGDPAPAGEIAPMFGIKPNESTSWD